MWLLIDDMRDSMGCDAVARTANGARKLLKECKWDGLCLDHDLGGSETGYDILMWAIENFCVPPLVQLVTSNPVGRDRMGAALVEAGWVKKSPINYAHKDHEWAE